MTEWISVKETSPNFDDLFLISNKRGDIEIARYDPQRKKFYQSDINGYPIEALYFTHWMPLPEPPTED